MESNIISGLVIIGTSLISGLLGSVLTLWWQDKNRIKNKKMQIFETLMAYRYMVFSQESVNAMNSIDVVFYKDEKVRQAYKDFINETEKKPEANPNIGDKYLKLLEEIAKVLDYENIHWDDIKRSYYPNGLADKIQEETMLRKMQIESVAANIAIKQNSQNTSTDNQFTERMVLGLLPELLKNPESLKLLMEFGNKNGSQSNVQPQIDKKHSKKR